MSKAVFVLQHTQVFQRAVFFSMLNPQPNGAGFAGVRTDVSFDVSGCSQLELDLRAQGSASYYKVLFRHNGETGEGTFEQVFQVSSAKVLDVHTVHGIQRISFRFRSRPTTLTFNQCHLICPTLNSSTEDKKYLTMSLSTLPTLLSLDSKSLVEFTPSLNKMESPH